MQLNIQALPHPKPMAMMKKAWQPFLPLLKLFLEHMAADSTNHFPG
jgi:hypothetical protein